MDGHARMDTNRRNRTGGTVSGASVWLVLKRLNASAEVETEKEERTSSLASPPIPSFFSAQISGQSALSSNSNQNCQILRRAKLVETANSRLQLLRTNGVFLALDQDL